jgi:N-carbamoyl-L-amino-acid hydrolase
LLSARRDPKTLAGYLELHIEQGPRLTRAGIQIGIVTSIVGIASWQIAFIGRADHAGTTPMTERLDAAQGASAFTLAVQQILQEQFAGCTANIGFLRLEPGAFNVVPARAELSLEYRSTDFSTMERLGKALLACAQDQATRYGLGLETHFLGQHKPAPMNLLAQHAIANACQTLGLSYSELPSGAGHDAQSLAELYPAGMIFVPSAAGASHSAREFTPWQDCLNGANTLLQASLDMASRCQPT